MFFRVLHIVKKELIQTLRDRRAFVILLVAPVAQLFIFGYVASTDVKMSAAVISDFDQSARSRSFIRAFSASGYFNDKYYTLSPVEFDRLIDSGRALVGVTIPPGFGESLLAGRSASVAFVLDATNSNLATILSGYIQFITGAYSAQVTTEFLTRKGQTVTLPLAVEPRIWFNPDLKSANFMVPGVIGMLTLIVLLNLTSLSIVRERELGTAEQLAVTPIRPLELVIGKSVPAIFAGFLVTTLVLVVGLLWFRINFAGSVLLLYGFGVFFMAFAVSMGLLISTFAQTGDQAMWANQFLMMPNVLLSGFIFPISNMPQIIQYFTYILPMRYYLRIVRGIFLQGAGFVELWPQAAALFGLGTVVAISAAIRLRKHLV